MKFTSKDMIETFSYTEDEQEPFAYIRKYMKLITPRLHEIEKDREKLKRFALIGLFLEYRACNHLGKDLTTNIDSDDLENRYVKRTMAVKEFFDLEIINSLHYLEMINFTFFDFYFAKLRLKNISK